MTLPAAIARDAMLSASFSIIAQAVTVVDQDFRSSRAAIFGLYTGLAVLASLLRTLYDARDGILPPFAKFRYGLAIGLFIGLAGSAVFMELDWAPGWKMFTILVAGFTPDLTAAAIRKWAAARIARALTAASGDGVESGGTPPKASGDRP